MTSNELREPLIDICNALDGALGATIMGFDGLPVDSYEATSSEASGGAPDVAALFVEYTALLGQVKQSAQMFAAGGLEELSIRSKNLVAIIRPINEDYFVALALLPRANTGKGRYLLRIHAPKLAGPLS